MASTRWRCQFGKGLGVVSSLRAGRIRVRPRPGLAKNASVSSPARPLSVTTAVPGAGRLAGLVVTVTWALVLAYYVFQIGSGVLNAS